MHFVWDPRKGQSNLEKHGVDFADAAVALEDENALTIADTQHREFRFKTLAVGPTPAVLFIIYAEQDKETVSIISARRADRNEQRQYFEGGFHD